MSPQGSATPPGSGGARHGVLTPDDVRQIRAALAAGIGTREVAARYDVSPRMIALIRSGRRWANVR